MLGALIYLFVLGNFGGIGLKAKLDRRTRETKGLLAVDPGTRAAMEECSAQFKGFAHYMEHSAGFPAYHNTTAVYYPLGEDKFADLLIELRKAEKFIFLEYFIVARGHMWDAVLEILKEKVKAGVEVRVMYDGMCSILLLPYHYPRELKSYGIKAKMFAPIVPFLSTTQNNRDHRKILVIDGRVAFTGGVNLADEYINEEHPFGHWKDIGFEITGDAIRSYTFMFIEFWNASSLNKITKELVGDEFAQGSVSTAFDGYVLPYYDSPGRAEAASNNLFIDLLGQARDYIWFYTPYLLLGDGLREAFVRAAQRGVDVRIIMPGIPDKKVVYRMSRSYYRELLEAGVKIFEYSPGFVHAKACLADDCVGSIGTVNLDYRSLYLHYECNALFYKASVLIDLKKDFEASMKMSRECTLQGEKKGLLHRIINGTLRIFAPLV